MLFRPHVRHRFSVPLLAVILATLTGASLLVGAVAAPASAQASGGESTPVVVRDGVWYLRNSTTTGAADSSFRYGNAGDFPIMGDWNGDGTDTPGVVRGTTWLLRDSNTTGTANISFSYGGNPGDIPVVGDWNGDGIDTPGVVSGGTWFLRNSNTTGTADLTFRYGNAEDAPVVGDWNGDGIDTPGAVRGDTWFLRNSSTAGVAEIAFRYGNFGDVPVVGDWNSDGVETPGVVRGHTWFLRNSNASGVAEISFRYGNAGDRPLVRDGTRTGGGGEFQTLERGDRGPAVTDLQHGLDRLGFWVGPKDGIFGELTEQAVYAIQKYEGLPITGVVDEATRHRIDHGPHVQAAATSGDVVEVDKSRQLVFIVRNGFTVWAFNASTGDNEPYTYDGQQYIADTPSGHFEIFRQIDGWRESHLGRLYRPKYFTTNGIALHGSTFVPPYPVSHGCVRVTIPAINYIWDHDLAPIGITVHLYGTIPS